MGGCVQEEGVSPKPDEECEHWEVLALYRAMEDAESVREREGKEYVAKTWPDWPIKYRRSTC